MGLACNGLRSMHRCYAQTSFLDVVLLLQRRQSGAVCGEVGARVACCPTGNGPFLASARLQAKCEPRSPTPRCSPASAPPARRVAALARGVAPGACLMASRVRALSAPPCSATSTAPSAPAAGHHGCRCHKRGHVGDCQGHFLSQHEEENPSIGLALAPLWSRGWRLHRSGEAQRTSSLQAIPGHGSRPVST